MKDVPKEVLVFWIKWAAGFWLYWAIHKPWFG